jgi:hypothetical protein
VTQAGHAAAFASAAPASLLVAPAFCPHAIVSSTSGKIHDDWQGA